MTGFCSRFHDGRYLVQEHHYRFQDRDFRQHILDLDQHLCIPLYKTDCFRQDTEWERILNYL
jgi:hypothetical protein